MLPIRIVKETAVAGLVISALAALTGCQMNHPRAQAPVYAPSGGGAAVAAARPGAGVGAQTGVGAAADVPSAIQKGAGASNLAPNPAANLGGVLSNGARPIKDPNTIATSPDPASLSGEPVDLAGLKVQQVIGNELLALSSGGSGEFYARLHQPAPGLQQGDTVNLTGTVQRVPANAAILGLSEQATTSLQNQPIYIDTQQIQVTNR